MKQNMASFPSSTSAAASSGGGGGRPVLKNAGPVLMSPGGTLNFNVPLTPDASKGSKESFSASPPAPQLETPTKTRSSTKDGLKLSRLPIRRELFGGAMTLMLPETFEDVSVLREVPDHQEVFVDRDSEVSLIVELLEYDGAVTGEDAAQYYFKDLASFNDVCYQLGPFLFVPIFPTHPRLCSPPPSIIIHHPHLSPLIPTCHHSSSHITTHYHSSSFTHHPSPIATHHHSPSLIISHHHPSSLIITHHHASSLIAGGEL